MAEWTKAADRSLNLKVSCKHTKFRFYHKNVADLDCIPFKRVRLRKKYKIKRSLLEGGSIHSSSRLVDPQLYCLTCHKSRRVGYIFPFATTDDGLTVNASPQASTSGDVEDLRVKEDQPLKHEDYNIALVQSLHDAARVFELAIRGQSSVSKLASWFLSFWLRCSVQNARLQPLSYQTPKVAMPNSQKGRDLPGLSQCGNALKPHGLVGKIFGNYGYQK
ncbi:hypothetical protein Tco_0602484 [Tanacetum coccineum]